MEDFFFNSSKELKVYLESLKLSSDREYFHIESILRDEDRSFLKILNCRRQHMIVYFPDGTIQLKENICICDNCFVGELKNCKLESGKILFQGDNGSESEESESEESESEDEGEESDEDEVNYELVGDTVFEAVEVGSVVAVYSSFNSSELFYLCEVKEKCVASENETDQYNHVVTKGSSFFKCFYLDKVKEKKGEVYYKRIEKTTFVLPYQVFLPSVQIDNKLAISSSQYMDLLSMI